MFYSMEMAYYKTIWMYVIADVEKSSSSRNDIGLADEAVYLFKSGRQMRASFAIQSRKWDNTCGKYQVRTDSVASAYDKNRNEKEFRNHFHFFVYKILWVETWPSSYCPSIEQFTNFSKFCKIGYPISCYLFNMLNSFHMLLYNLTHNIAVTY